MLFRQALATLAVIVVAGCAAGPPPGATQLSSVQLRNMIVGHTISGHNEYGQPYTEEYRKDGSVVGHSVNYNNGASPITDNGHWQIDGNAICVKWNHWRNGARRCLHIVTAGHSMWVDGYPMHVS